VSSVVERVVAAINAHDLEAMLGCYAPDATIEDGYDTVGARGQDEMRERYGMMFERFPELSIETGWRTAVGSFVLQEETVTGRGDHQRHVAVYLIHDDLIARERLIA
jgi:hypothetical protein